MRQTLKNLVAALVFYGMVLSPLYAFTITSQSNWRATACGAGVGMMSMGYVYLKWRDQIITGVTECLGPLLNPELPRETQENYARGLAERLSGRVIIGIGAVLGGSCAWLIARCLPNNPWVALGGMRKIFTALHPPYTF